jgi:hypothetical protein
MAVFSSRKGQALEALTNALGRCEREGITIVRSTDDMTEDCVAIMIPGSFWRNTDILLVEEIGIHPEI